MRTPRWLAIVAMVSLLLFPALVTAQDATPTAGPSGIIASVSTSVTLSTEGMVQGMEIWALWTSMPAGAAVDVPGTDLGQSAAMGLALSGATIVSEGGSCIFIPVGGHVRPEVDGNIMTVKAGDAEACAYSSPQAYRLENTGTEPYVYASLSLGTPWVEGMPNYGELFGKAGAAIDGYQIVPSTFAAAEEEILATGAVTLTIRQVTVPPGGRIVADDRYPTIRLVWSGYLTWGSVPTGTKADPEHEFRAYRYGWLGWSIVPPGNQTVLINRDDEPLVFVEWSVTPA